MNIKTVIMAAIAMGLALACGGDEDVASTSYTGSVDRSAITDSSESYMVKAYAVNGTSVASVATSETTLSDAVTAGIDGAEADSDYVYTLENLIVGTDYMVQVEKTLDGTSVVALSTAITASSESSENATLLSKPIAGLNLPQINVYTTLVANTYAEALSQGVAFSIELALTVVFGSADVDLEALIVEDGAVSIVAVEGATLSIDTTAVAASLESAAAGIIEAVSQIVSAGTPEDLALISSLIVDLVAVDITFTGLNLDNVAELTAAFETFTEAVEEAIEEAFQEFVADNPDADIEIPDSVDLSPPVVSSFTLADSSYGSQSGSSFTIGTLEPVFMVTFDTDGATPSEGIEDAVSVSISNGTTTVELDSDSAAATYVWSGDMMTLYIAVNNGTSEGSLNPGVSYTYSITTDADEVTLSDSLSSGTVETMDVTITASEVAIEFSGTDWDGVDVDDIEFTVDVKSGSSIKVQDADRTDLGLVNSLTVTGISGTYTDGAFEVSNSDSTGSAITTATLSLSSSVQSIFDFATYTVTPDLNLVYTGSTSELVAGTDYISTLKVTLKGDDAEVPAVTSNSTVSLKTQSVTEDVFLTLEDDFSDVNIYTVLTSEDELPNSSDSDATFVYGSMADGAGLIANSDGTFTLINNIEADYSVARIEFDSTFAPVSAEIILDADATSDTAQCSGTLITPEEHGFDDYLYLSGGEWGGSAKGVFATEITKDAADSSDNTFLTALGQWSTENAVPIGKDAYSDKTVVFIGDDHSDNSVPSGQLGMYVGDRGDLTGGRLYVLKVTDADVTYEMDMEEGVAYSMEFVEMSETEKDALDTEAKAAGAMGFSRLEDIDWRRGDADAQREVYLTVTGRKKDDLVGKGTLYGRIYKVELNDEDPTGAGTITCVLDGDDLDGKAASFHSPDNITVTYNYAYIQEDPNGYPDTDAKDHWARLYQYNLNTGELKVVLECDQDTAATAGYGTTDKTWELTGMIDVSDILGKEDTFLLITQNHGWEPAEGVFTDAGSFPSLTDLSETRAEGSMLFIVEGLAR